MMAYMLITIKFLFMMIPVLMSVAYLTLLESKILGYSQSSKGPNIVGLYGLLQPLADGVKLFSKEFSIPSHANMFSYIISPMMALSTAFVFWTLIPILYNSSLTQMNLTLLFMLALSSMSAYSMLLAGWSSNSKYAFLGSMSAVAQMISYEVSIGLMLMSMVMMSGSMNMVKIIIAQNESVSFFMPMTPMFLMLFVSCLAETNSAPFDLTEGESELVSGFNVEYASMAFALFFLAEYSHIIFMSFMISVLLFSGKFIFTMKLLLTGLVVIMFVWVSTSFPSVSYDKLMALLWKSYLPMSIFLMVFYFLLLMAGNMFSPMF